MSMLSLQAEELREKADELRNVHVDDENVGLLFAAIGVMREAADTIESLRDRLQEVGDQACHATQPNYEHCKYSTNRGWCDTSRYAELFGTPERAARTLEKGKTLCAWCDKQTCSTSGGECRIYDYDALLEWLRGDAE